MSRFPNIWISLMEVECQMAFPEDLTAGERAFVRVLANAESAFAAEAHIRQLTGQDGFKVLSLEEPELLDERVQNAEVAESIIELAGDLMEQGPPGSIRYDTFCLYEYIRSLATEHHWTYYAAWYDPDCLEKENLPWGSNKFDCVIVNMDQEWPPELAKAVALEVCKANTWWVTTTGPRAEWLHDLIDETAVEIGRQAFVGEDLCTAWEEDAHTLPQIADVADVHGSSGTTLVLFVCSQEKFAQYVSQLQDALVKQIAENQEDD